MASPLTLIMYAIVGPFAILKLYAKNLMRRAYGNQILLKLAASIVSLAVGSEIAFKYRTQHTFIWLTSGLFTSLLNYWYIIPLNLIYIVPIVEKMIRSWLSFIDLFAGKILRPYSTKFREFLPAIWTFESNRKLWPIESIRFMLTYGCIGPGLYCGYEIYSHLFLGISFNLCISIGGTILVVTTLWRILEAIDRDLYPFIFAIIVQYYIIPIKSILNIPLTLLLTTVLFPFLNNLLISHSIQDFINNLKLLHFRTFLEGNVHYKQFFSEFSNIIISIYLTYSVMNVCFTIKVSWFLIISILGFLPIYLYTNFIRLMLIEPNTLMFLFTSFLLSKSILLRSNDDHFISKYFLLIMILTFYYALIYPLLYHILRRSFIKSANAIGLKLKSSRETIHQYIQQITEQYLRITYIHDLSKDLILHLCNLSLSLCVLIFIPINLFVRMIFALICYLLIGRILFTRGLEILGMLVGLCTSLTAGVHVYAYYENSLLLTMSIGLITYVSTLVIAFPMIYCVIQLLIICFPWSEVVHYYLKEIFRISWSYFDLIWPHILRSFDEVKEQIEKSKINIFRHSSN